MYPNSKQKPSPIRGRVLKLERVDVLVLEFLDLVGLGAFLTLDDFELHVVTFLKTLISFRNDGAVVYENIRPFVAADESKSLRVVKPLDFAFHLRHLLLPPYLGSNRMCCR